MLFKSGLSSLLISTCLLLAACQQTPTQTAKALVSAQTTWTASTLAGNGTYGYVDAQGESARFYNPSAIALLPEGELLVMDRYNHRIRKIDQTGTVSTFWGQGERGNKDGNNGEGRLNQPIALIVKPDSQILIADAQNHSLRQLSREGILTTLAGNGNESGRDPDNQAVIKDGPALKADFNWPADLAADAAGNVYIADRFNHAIRRLSPDGQVSTLAGNGSAGYEEGLGKKASFNEPMGIVLGPDQALYVSDSQNNVIRRVSLEGAVTTYAGSGQAGSRDDSSDRAEFRTPAGLDFDKAGNLYVADRLNHRIRMISKDRQVYSLGGNGKATLINGKGTDSAFSYPFDVAVGAQGQLYVADYSNHAVRVLKP
jgi:hypothetical protein